MKKNNYLMSALLLGGMLLSTLTAGAEDRVVKLTTSQAVGTEMTFLVNRTYAGVTVDWGDGFPVTYNTGTDAIREVKGTVKGTSITITGNAAWDMFSCASCSVETIDLSGATGLRSLFCQDNNLSIISMKGMSNLVDLDASNNQLTSIEYTKSSNPSLTSPRLRTSTCRTTSSPEPSSSAPRRCAPSTSATTSTPPCTCRPTQLSMPSTAATTN